MTAPGDRSSAPQVGLPTPRPHDTFSRRRAMVLFVTAGIAALLALTSSWWLPILKALFAAVGGPTEVIGFLADVAQLVPVVLWLVTIVLGYLGVRSFRSANAGGELPQSVDAAQGGRGAAVGGDVNQGVVVAGNQNQVSLQIAGGVTYDYSQRCS